MSLVTSDVKQHSRWCPCCHQYQKGEDPTPEQISEFLEYVRKRHFYRPSKMKPRSQVVDGDSVSEITDLSKEGVLTKHSLKKLSKLEKSIVKDVQSKWRNLVKFQIPKHNCSKRKRSKRAKTKVYHQMELRCLSEPRSYNEDGVSAHQFSARSQSVQVDNRDLHREIAMQTSVISQGRPKS